MHNELQVFLNEEFGEIRFLLVNGIPFVAGVDIARALDYANPSKAVIDHCKGITKMGIPSAGGIQETNMIPRGDIYRLIFKAAEQSRNSNIRNKANKFESWVFDDLIPNLMEYGTYSINEKNKQLDAENQQLRLEAENNQEHVDFSKAVQEADGEVMGEDFAFICVQNGINFHVRKLYAYWRSNKWTKKRTGESYNQPTAKAVKAGYMTVRESIKPHHSGVVFYKSLRVTAKGQRYFLKKLRELSEKEKEE